MQGKRQHIRKINRKARGMGETYKQREGLPPPPQALAENRWAGGRGAPRLHPSYAPWGQEGGSQECSDWASHAHHRSLWRGGGGHPCSSVVFYNSNHSRLKKALRTKYCQGKSWSPNRHPLTWIGSFFRAPRAGPKPVLFIAVFLAPSTTPGTQHSLSKHLLSKCLGEKV